MRIFRLDHIDSIEVNRIIKQLNNREGNATYFSIVKLLEKAANDNELIVALAEKSSTFTFYGGYHQMLSVIISQEPLPECNADTLNDVMFEAYKSNTNIAVVERRPRTMVNKLPKGYVGVFSYLSDDAQSFVIVD